MQNLEFAQILVVILALFIGLILGVTAQKIRFCTMGAIADVVHMRAWHRAMAYALALAVATLGFQIIITLHPHAALLRSHVLYLSPQWPWASGLVGGFLFGVGMVLASGCGLKNLLRLGQGSFKAAFVLLIMAIAALATLKGLVAVARVQWLDPWVVGHPTRGLNGDAWLGVWIGPAATPCLMALAAVAALALGWALYRQKALGMALGATAVGGSIAAMWLLMFTLGFVLEHPNTLEPAYLATYTNRPEAASFVAPLAYALEWLLYFSDPSRKATAGMSLALGVVLGGWLQAKRSGSLHWEGFSSLTDTRLHVMGAVLMGVGGVLGWGCSIGQGLSGMSTLALGSWVTVIAMVFGAVATLRWLE